MSGFTSGLRGSDLYGASDAVLASQTLRGPGVFDRIGEGLLAKPDQSDIDFASNDPTGGIATLGRLFVKSPVAQTAWLKSKDAFEAFIHSDAARGMADAQMAGGYNPDAFDYSAPRDISKEDLAEIFKPVSADEQARIDSEHRARRDQIKALSPDPAKVGLAGQIVFGVSSGLLEAIPATIAAGPAGGALVLGGAEGYAGREDLIDAGVDEITANWAGLGAGAANALGVSLPGALPVVERFGFPIAQKAATGAGLNVILGVAERGGTSAWLRANGYEEQAKRYEWNDTAGLASDAILGAVFGAMHTEPGEAKPRFNPGDEPKGEPGGPRAPSGDDLLQQARQFAIDGEFEDAYAHALVAKQLGAEGADDILAGLREEYDDPTDLENGGEARASALIDTLNEKFAGAPRRFDSDTVSAAAVIADARHRDLETAPGIPISGRGDAAHAQALDLIAEQSSNDEQFHIPDGLIREEDFVPKPPRGYDEADVESIAAEIEHEHRINRQTDTPIKNFIIREGGVKDDRGDLAAVASGKDAARLFNATNGRSLDDLALRAWEKGLLHLGESERPTTHDLIDALDAELRGETGEHSQNARDVLGYWDRNGVNTSARGADLRESIRNSRRALSDAEIDSMVNEAMDLEEGAPFEAIQQRVGELNRDLRQIAQEGGIELGDEWMFSRGGRKPDWARRKQIILSALDNGPAEAKAAQLGYSGASGYRAQLSETRKMVRDLQQEGRSTDWIAQYFDVPETAIVRLNADGRRNPRSASQSAALGRLHQPRIGESGLSKGRETEREYMLSRADGLADPEIAADLGAKAASVTATLGKVRADIRRMREEGKSEDDIAATWGVTSDIIDEAMKIRPKGPKGENSVYEVLLRLSQVKDEDNRPLEASTIAKRLRAMGHESSTESVRVYQSKLRDEMRKAGKSEAEIEKAIPYRSKRGGDLMFSRGGGSHFERVNLPAPWIGSADVLFNPTNRDLAKMLRDQRGHDIQSVRWGVTNDGAVMAWDGTKTTHGGVEAGTEQRFIAQGEINDPLELPVAQRAMARAKLDISPEYGKEQGNGQATPSPDQRRPDPVERAGFQERLGRAQAALDGIDPGRTGRILQRSEEGRSPAYPDGTAPDPRLGRVAREVLAASSLRIAPWDAPIGHYKATVDAPEALPPELYDALIADNDERARNVGIDFDIVRGAERGPKKGPIEWAMRDDGVYITYSAVTDVLRGQGVGTWLYRQLIDWAHRQELAVYSDSSLTKDSYAIYEKRLVDAGYHVTKVNEASWDAKAKVWETPDFSPIFKVEPSGHETAYEHAPPPRGDINPDGSSPRLADRITQAKAAPQFSRGGYGRSSVEELKSGLSDYFGPDFQRALDFAGLELHDLPGDVGLHSARYEDASGLHNPRTGKSYLFAGNTSVERAKGTLLHEIGEHAGMEEMLGPKLYGELQKHLEALHASGNFLVRRAFELAQEYAAHQSHLPAERLAYTIEEAQRASNEAKAGEGALPPITFKNDLAQHADEAMGWLMEHAPDLPIVKRTLAAIRQWLVRTFGDRFGRELSVEDIRQLAIASFRRVARMAERKARAAGGEDFMTSMARRAPAFYSSLSRAVSENKTSRASAQQWKATLSKTPGVKKEELEWTGVNEWLDAQEGPITREALQEFVSNNGVQVQEVLKGGAAQSTMSEREAQTRLLPLIEERDRISNAMDREDDSANIADMVARAEQLQSQIDELEPIAHGDLGRSKTRWSQFTLPGALPGSYRELLLTIPVKAIDAETVLEKQRRINKIVEQMDAMARDRLPDNRMREEAEWRRLAQERDRLVEEARAANDAGFKSSHWDERNILAHVRFDERTDADGKRTLFLEEIQSDAHQKGREHGYKNDAEFRRIRKKLIDAGEEGETIDALVGQGRRVTDAVIERIKKILTPEELARLREETGTQRIPDLPFKNNSWAALAMKRIIKYASDEGYDQIAWPPGDVQNERFSLEKHVKKIDWVKHKDGTFDISADDLNGRQAFSQSKMSEQELAGVVGKEIADKIVGGEGKKGTHTAQSAMTRYGVVSGDEYGNLSGLDLKVGGEGMKAFYDKILPNIANDIAKKSMRQGSNFVPRVETAEISQLSGKISDASMARDANGWIVFWQDGSGSHRKEGFATEEEAKAFIKKGIKKPVTVHALPLTPDLRNQALDEGFPLFSKGGGKKRENVPEEETRDPDPVKQTLADDPGMKIATDDGEVSAEKAYEDAKADTEGAKLEAKSFDAAASCAIQHGLGPGIRVSADVAAAALARRNAAYAIGGLAGGAIGTGAVNLDRAKQAEQKRLIEQTTNAPIVTVPDEPSRLDNAYIPSDEDNGEGGGYSTNPLTGSPLFEPADAPSGAGTFGAPPPSDDGTQYAAQIAAERAAANTGQGGPDQ